MSTADYYSIVADIQPGDTRVFNVVGTFLYCFDASHTDFRVRLGDQYVQFFAQGIGLETSNGERFEKVQIENTSGADVLQIVLGYGMGRIHDNRLSLLGGALPVEPTAANTPFAIKVDPTSPVFPVRHSLAASEINVSVNAGGTSTVLGAANANRKAVELYNDGAGVVWVRSVNAAGRIGLPISPGETRRFETSAALFIHNPSTAAVRVTGIVEAWT
ncbi:MAG: hypothetical protein AAFY01_01715 [Pseudomonadota bacterium]